ncbi:hypothetical protein AJ80_00741 [Polytolypa hystricis UAMH7299]|uniref:SAP domain-containing protein n=1 Tax=Polytolypa hystricis (strain UAMH7299) TaxID=1447883 RepID=A0A2B7Z279_POLH7|nr:hypothetical protein AJ80_00741 [Polytolypa hystricis UAMH7299]
MSALSPKSWLSALKVAQLTRIAFLTGVPSTGTKSALIERLDTALRNCSILESAAKRVQATLKKGAIKGEKLGLDSKNGPKKNGISLLSIDMGIRNLAYSHLIIPAPSDKQGEHESLAAPILNAWNRLDVSSLRTNSPTSGLLPTLGSRLSAELEPGDETLRSVASSDTPLSLEEQESEAASLPPGPEKESYSPSGYAALAYTLITSLISMYKPTHVLIERQRFRTGGLAAVPEWTIRVGIFEATLYGVLHTLKQERCIVDTDLVVEGIDPKRVANYWVEMDPHLLSNPDKPELQQEDRKDRKQKVKLTKKKLKKSTKETKRAKMDVVARWLEDSLHETNSNYRNLRLSDSGPVNELVHAYLNKWGNNQTKNTPSAIDIGKLDDLADCLLQGLTWMAWQDMRRKIAVQGLPAVTPELENK